MCIDEMIIEMMSGFGLFRCLESIQSGESNGVGNNNYGLLHLDVGSGGDSIAKGIWVISQSTHSQIQTILHTG